VAAPIRNSLYERECSMRGAEHSPEVKMEGLVSRSLNYAEDATCTLHLLKNRKQGRLLMFYLHSWTKNFYLCRQIKQSNII